MRPNGSPLILPTPPAQAVLTRQVPGQGVVQIAFPCEADPRTIDPEAMVKIPALLLNELLVGLAETQQRCAGLSSQLAAVLVVLAEGTAESDPGESVPAEQRERIANAREHVRRAAAGCTIVPATPASPLM